MVRWSGFEQGPVSGYSFFPAKVEVSGTWAMLRFAVPWQKGTLR